MSVPSSPAPAGKAPAASRSASGLAIAPFDAAVSTVPEPYLHLGPDRVYNPLTDRLLREGEPGYALLRSLLAGEATVAGSATPELEQLRHDGWLVADDGGLDRRFLLKYASIEAHTVCNQACYFCPVSVAPREDFFMPTEQYERIVGELAAFRSTLEAVFMINYNEPTADPRFVEQVRTIRRAGLPPAVLTNGSGLTPARVDQLLESGGVRFLSINLSTLDRERYADTRGGDHLPIVLRNLDYVKDKPVAERMDIVVLGTGDEAHRRDHEEIGHYFAGSRFDVKYYEVMDRAGYLQIGMKAALPERRLAGCENGGSRPLQHIHITPRAKVVFCCEDYDEYHIVGDLNESSIAQVLAGDEIAKLRRWSYGLEESPAHFMCRKCTYALRR
jgi:molybdenum cofactor biosynthesis enzyme MoaA